MRAFCAASFPRVPSALVAGWGRAVVRHRRQSWVVDVTTTPEFGFKPPIQFPIRRYAPIGLGVREYDVLPDGQRFVFAFPQNANETGTPFGREMQIVVNWTEELTAKLAQR